MLDEAFFIASKTLGMLARVESWLLILAALTLIAALRGRARAAAVWSGVLFAALLAMTLAPFGAVLLRDLELRYPANPKLDRVDAIIVLGGGEDLRPFVFAGQSGFNDAAERMTEAVVLARRFPEAKLVFTGGTARLGANPRHALPSQMTQAFWLSMGIDADRIILEDMSRTTSENARFTHDLLQPGPGQIFVLVTSAWHMPRSVATFQRAGWTDIVPWPVDFRHEGRLSWTQWKLDDHLRALNVALKEYLGLLAYALAGK